MKRKAGPFGLALCVRTSLVQARNDSKQMLVAMKRRVDVKEKWIREKSDDKI